MRRIASLSPSRVFTSRVFNRRTVLLAALAPSTLALQSCGAIQQPNFSRALFSNPMASERSAIPSGSIVIARKVPPISPNLGGETVLAFSPLPESLQTHSTINTVRLTVDLNKQLATLADGDELPVKTVSKSIQSGLFQVQLIQEQPKWHASDEYYSARRLTAPPRGSAQRFLNGALGSHAIFLNNDLMLHSSLEWSPEVGGIQIAPNQLQELIGKIKVGDMVRLKRE